MPSRDEQQDDLILAAAQAALTTQYVPAPSGPPQPAPSPTPAPVAPPPPAPAPPADYGYNGGIDAYAPQPAPPPAAPPTTGLDAVMPAPFQPWQPTVLPPISPTPNMAPYQYAGGNILESNWFGTPDQQQAQSQNFQAELDSAIQSGDMEHYNALLAEANAVSGAWSQIQALRSPQGEGLGRPVDYGPGPQYWPGMAADPSGLMEAFNVIQEQAPQAYPGAGADISGLEAYANMQGGTQEDTLFNYGRPLWQGAPDEPSGWGGVLHNIKAGFDNGIGSGAMGVLGALTDNPYMNQDISRLALGPAGPLIADVLPDAWNNAIPSTGLSLGEANQKLAGPLNRPWENLKRGVAYNLTEAGRFLEHPEQLFYDPDARQHMQEDSELAKQRVENFDRNYPVGNLALQLVFDPLNFFGPHTLVEIGQEARAAETLRRAQAGARPLVEAGLVPAEHVTEYANTMTRGDINRLPNAYTEIQTIISPSKAPIFTLNNGVLVDDMLAKKILFESQLAVARSGQAVDVNAIIQRNIADLPNIVSKLGGDANEVEKIVGLMNRTMTPQRIEELNAATKAGITARPVADAATVTGQQITTNIEAIDSRFEEIMTPGDVRTGVTEFPQPVRMTADEFMAQNPNAYHPGAYGNIIDPELELSRTVSEAQLRVLEKVAAKQHVVPFDPIRDLSINPEHRTTGYVANLIDHQPPTVEQFYLARALYQEGKLPREIAARIYDSRTGRATVDIEGASEILETAAGAPARALRAKGYHIPLDPSDPEWGQAWYHAVQEDALKTQAADYIGQLLPAPETTPHKNVAMRGAYKAYEKGRVTPFTGLQVMTPAEIRPLFTVEENGARLLLPQYRGTELDGPLTELVKDSAFVGRTGVLSSRSYNNAFWQAMDQLQVVLRGGGISLPLVKDFGKTLLAHYKGSAVDTAMEEAQATQRMAALPEARKTTVAAKIEEAKTTATQAAQAGDMQTARESEALVKQYEPTFEAEQPPPNPDENWQAQQALVHQKLAGAKAELDAEIAALQQTLDEHVAMGNEIAADIERTRQQQLTEARQVLELQPQRPPSHAFDGTIEEIGNAASSDALLKTKVENPVSPFVKPKRIINIPRPEQFHQDLQALSDAAVQVATPMEEAALRAVESGKPARFTAYRGGYEDFTKTQHEVIYAGRDPKYGATFSPEGGVHTGVIPEGRGLSVLDIRSENPLNLMNVPPDARLPGFNGPSEALTALFPDRPDLVGREMDAFKNFIHEPTPAQVEYLRSKAGGEYDLIITDEGGDLGQGSFLILDPAITDNQAFIQFRDAAPADVAAAATRGSAGPDPIRAQNIRGIRAQIDSVQSQIDRATRPGYQAEEWAVPVETMRENLKSLEDELQAELRPRGVPPVAGKKLSATVTAAFEPEVYDAARTNPELNQALTRFEGRFDRLGEARLAPASEFQGSKAAAIQKLEGQVEGLAKEVLRLHGSGPPAQAGLFDTGGLGIVHPFARPRKPVPTIDFAESIFASTSPAEIGKQWDAAMREHYSLPAIDGLPAETRYESQLLSDVTRKTDAWGAFLMADSHRIKAEFGENADLVAIMKDRIEMLGDVAREEEARRTLPWFFEGGESGADALQAHRYHYKAVLRDWETLDPNTQLGKLGPDILPPTRADRTFSQDAIAQLDRYMSGKGRPKGMDKITRRRFDTFVGMHKKTWMEKIRPQLWDEEAGRFKPGAHIDELNKILAGGQDGVVDLPKMIDRASSVVAQEEAARIGLDWRKMPISLKIGLAFKRELAPFWMTMNPYHLFSNVGGNLTSPMLAALRNDIDVAPRLFKSHFESIQNELGSHPYLESELIAEQTGSPTEFVGRQQRKAPYTERIITSKVFNPISIKGKKIGPGGWFEGLRDANNSAERWSRSRTFGGQYDNSYGRYWPNEVEALPIERDFKDALIQAWTPREVQRVLEEHLGPITDADGLRQTITARHSLAVDQSIHDAYDATALVLRDYRMRNKMDGLLDRVVPINYWTTRNISFVSSTLFQKPGAALAGWKAYDMWQEKNKDLPPSFRTGYLPAPVGWIPGVGTDVYWMRLTNMTNPALWMIPKLLNPQGYNMDGTSLPDRIINFGKSGTLNAYNAVGLKPGPQWDIILKLAAAGFRGGADVTGSKGLDWMADRLAEAQIVTHPTGYHADVPIIDTLSFGQLHRSQAYEHLIQQGYQFIEGAPYTRFEVTGMFTSANETRLKEVRACGGNQSCIVVANDKFDAVSRAMAANQWQDPAVKTVVDDYMGNRANLNLIARGGASGRVYTDGWKSMYEAGQEFNRRAQSGGNAVAQEYGRTPAAHKRIEPWLRRYLDNQVATGKMDRAGADGVLDDVLHNGNFNNPTFQKALEVATNLRDAGPDTMTRDDLMQMNAFMGANQLFENIVNGDAAIGTKGHRKSGLADAYTWMEANEPGLPGYWLATDDPNGRNQKFLNMDRQDMNEKRYAEAAAFYEAQDATASKAAPYYDRIKANLDRYDQTVIAAHGNPALLIAAKETRDNVEAGIRSQAAEHGIDLLGKGKLPREGRGYTEFRYQGLSDGLPRRESDRLQDAGYPEQRRDMERQQAQRGWVLDRVVDQLGIRLWVRDENGDYVRNDQYWVQDENGHWDIDPEYKDVLKDAAELAPRMYRDIAYALAGAGTRAGGEGRFDLGTITANVTPDDFLYHIRAKDGAVNDLVAEKYKALAVAKAMPYGTPEERAARESAYAAIEATYSPYDKTYQAGGGFTAEENTRFNEGARLVADWYYTLTPRQKDEFKATYGNAFTKDENGRDKFVSTQLHGDQIADLVTTHQLGHDVLIESPGRGGAVLARQEADRVAASERVYTLVNERKASLTPEQSASLDALSEKRGEDRTMTDLAFQTKDAAGTWKKAEDRAIASGDLGLANWIHEYRDLTVAAGENGAYDAQDAWFNGLSDPDKQLLITEDPTVFGRYAEDATSGGSGGTSVSTGSGTTVSGGGYSGSGGTSTSGKPATTGTLPRTSGTQSVSKSTVVSLVSLDPTLSAGSDDGRYATVQQVGAALESLMAAFPNMDKATSAFLMQGYLRWIKSQLGMNPDPTTWQRILDELTRPSQAQYRQKTRPPMDYGVGVAAG